MTAGTGAGVGWASSWCWRPAAAPAPAVPAVVGLPSMLRGEADLRGQLPEPPAAGEDAAREAARSRQAAADQAGYDPYRHEPAVDRGPQLGL